MTAGDIAVSGDIEVMNKDLVICHLDEGAPFDRLRVNGPQHGTDRRQRQGLRPRRWQPPDPFDCPQGGRSGQAMRRSA